VSGSLRQGPGCGFSPPVCLVMPGATPPYRALNNSRSSTVGLRFCRTARIDVRPVGGPVPPALADRGIESVAGAAHGKGSGLCRRVLRCFDTVGSEATRAAPQHHHRRSPSQNHHHPRPSVTIVGAAPGPCINQGTGEPWSRAAIVGGTGARSGRTSTRALPPVPVRRYSRNVDVTARHNHKHHPRRSPSQPRPLTHAHR
jgi:hypothetical protein